MPLVVLTATDHASAPDFEREWRQIQAKVAAQSALGRQVIAEGSGHYIQDDQPELVIDLISRLLLQLRSKSVGLKIAIEAWTTFGHGRKDAGRQSA